MNDKEKNVMDLFSLLYGVEERKFTAECSEEYVEIENWKNFFLKQIEKGEIDIDVAKEEKPKFKKESLKNYFNLTIPCTCTDNLAEYLDEEKSKTFYYVGINQFVLDYYKKNPNSVWKIKAILQLGFPFDFIPEKEGQRISNYDFAVKEFLRNKKWSLFIFSKDDFTNIVLGFDDKNTYVNLQSIKDQRWYEFENRVEDLADKNPGSLCFVFNPHDEMRDNFIDDYLENDKVRTLTNEEKQKSGYSFAEVPVENFKLEYIDYLSRYKQSVVEIFGYPEKGEKITKLKNVVKFINAPGQKTVYPDDRKSNVLLKDLYFHDGKLKPTVRIGEQNGDYYTFFEEYEFYLFLNVLYINF